MYLDLMLIYDKFMDHLPHTYQQYKEKLHSKLPNIYDTKYMSLELKRVGAASLSSACLYIYTVHLYITYIYIYLYMHTVYI